MDFEIIKKQKFRGHIYKVKYKEQDYFIGVSHYEDGANIYYPQAGGEYLFILFNDRNYRFHINEFKEFVCGEYMMEKLHCSYEEAELVYNAVQRILIKEVKALLGVKNENISYC